MSAGRFGLVAVVALLVTPAAAGALSRPPTTVPAGLDQVAATPHFVVHYTTAAGDPNATTADHAQSLADAGERGYATIVGQWGFPAPLDDGDGKTDIYVFAGTQGLARGDSGGLTTTGYITYTTGGHPVHIPHEFFHLVQYGIYTRERGWLSESTADWAAISTAGEFSSKPFAFSRPEVPLDCTGTEPTDCGGDRYGYHASIFFLWLSERFGPGVVYEIFDRAAALGTGNGQSHSLQALGEVLAAHGTTVERAFGDYAIANQTGGYALPGLVDQRPARDSGQVVRARPLEFTVGVDHLAAQYVELASGADRCVKATLHLTVTAPAGVAAMPAYVAARGDVTPLTVGVPAEMVIGGCDGPGTLVLANGSVAGEGAAFAVQAHLEQAAAPVPRATITLAKRVKLRRKLRFTVAATAKGSFRASLGSRKTSGFLHKGVNRLAIKLPRGFAAGKRTLSVTPYSSSGERGTTVTRTVTLTSR